MDKASLSPLSRYTEVEVGFGQLPIGDCAEIPFAVAVIMPSAGIKLFSTAFSAITAVPHVDEASRTRGLPLRERNHESMYRTHSCQHWLIMRGHYHARWRGARTTETARFLQG